MSKRKGISSHLKKGRRDSGGSGSDGDAFGRGKNIVRRGVFFGEKRQKGRCFHSLRKDSQKTSREGRASHKADTDGLWGVGD